MCRACRKISITLSGKPKDSNRQTEYSWMGIFVIIRTSIFALIHLSINSMQFQINSCWNLLELSSQVPMVKKICKNSNEILKTKNEKEIILPSIETHYKAIIKIVGYQHKKGHILIEQNREFRNRHMYLWESGLAQRQHFKSFSP